MDLTGLEHEINGTTMPKCNDLYILLGAVNQNVPPCNRTTTPITV
jgi:hypothetical protein